MSSSKIFSEMKNRKTILSTLWIFVTVNYIYCDLISLMLPETIKQMMTGTIGVINVTQGFMLGASILMEIPMALILLSRVLKYKLNRWINIIAGLIMTTAQILSLFTGTAPTLHYIFFSTIEIACTLFIIYYSWKWKNTDTDNTTV
jgi:hypothetical protein